MKHDWKKQYSLQESLPNRDVSETVREKTLKKMSEDMQKGNIIMKSSKRKRIVAICAAAAAVMSLSAIGIHAAASTGLWQEITLWINGEEVTASLSKTDDNICIAVEGDLDATDSFEMMSSESFDVVVVDALDMNFYTECDSEGRLWLRADEEKDFAVDITDSINDKRTYALNCVFGDGTTKTVTVDGTIENNTITVTPVETEKMAVTDIPFVPVE